MLTDDERDHLLTRITDLVARNDEQMREEGRREVLWSAERDLPLRAETPALTQAQWFLMQALDISIRCAGGRPFTYVARDPASASIGIVIAHADADGVRLLRERVAELEARIPTPSRAPEGR